MMVFHPRDYRRLRNLAVLRLEVGDRAFRMMCEDSWLAIPSMFRELQS